MNFYHYILCSHDISYNRIGICIGNVSYTQQITHLMWCDGMRSRCPPQLLAICYTCTCMLYVPMTCTFDGGQAVDIMYIKTLLLCFHCIEIRSLV